jgi:hypothetical protein
MKMHGSHVDIPDDMNYLSAGIGRLAIERAGSSRELTRLGSSDARTIAGASARRFAKTVQAETAAEAISAARPAWLDGSPIPRLVISARYEGLDAFGAAQIMAGLDLAARRAGALQRQIAQGKVPEHWPDPLRTTQGGLRLLEVNLGSYEVLMTFWGGLVAVAGSAPVSVASFIALAWAERCMLGSAGADAQ